MSEEYVVSNAELECSCGELPVNLRVLRVRRIEMEGERVANRGDMRHPTEIGSFGICSSRQNVCTPILTPWLECKGDVIISGHLAVLKSSYLMCMAGGGKITVTGSGQK